jgi:hypothetical protein
LSGAAGAGRGFFILTLEVISKPIFDAILNQPRELKLEKSPPFSKGGAGEIK